MINNLVRKVATKLGSYIPDQFTREYKKQNFQYFGGGHGAGDSNEPIVLFEFNFLKSSHIAYSYLANVLASKYGARIFAYEANVIPTFLKKIEWMFAYYLSLREFAVYRSFGVTNFFQIQQSGSQLDKARQLTAKILSEIKTKSDIELIHLDGILLGDLIYDSYLNTYRKETIEISDKKFEDFLLRAVGIYVFWDEYFNTHNVKAVNASHSVYTFAMPLRIAISRGIPAFVSAPFHIYRLSKDKMFDGSDFFEFRKTFSSLPENVRLGGLDQAEQRIALRFSGQVGVDMRYSTKSAYGAKKKERLLKESNRTKVLIATHCFFDNPHGYGNNLFPDFYEWLEFLGKMTMETDYDWYLKTHPDYISGTMEIINSFLNKYPRFHLLPADSSHHQIIAEGIDVALTCYGTIGFEYAALGIPVVNASINNPHIAYNFNLHPKNVNEYRDLIGNLDKIKLDIDINEVYEYYFMKHIHDAKDLLYSDYNKMLDDIGGDEGLITSKAYWIWMRDFSSERHNELIQKIELFVESGKYRL